MLSMLNKYDIMTSTLIDQTFCEMWSFIPTI